MNKDNRFYSGQAIKTKHLLVTLMSDTFWTQIMLKSQTGYVFLYGNTKISWKSISSNHTEIIVLSEASRECIWLRRIMDYINVQCGLPVLTKPIVLFKDNFACVEQVSKGFIKGDQIKHISPKFFFIHEQQGDTIQSADHSQERQPCKFIHRTTSPSNTPISLPSHRP
jgi:hypothetical protein